MGDMVFFIPPVLETLKRRDPSCHVTFVTGWGFKDRRGNWGKRNMGGFSIHLMQTNPHIDQLVHWHDTRLSLKGDLCQEDGQRIPTWNAMYYEQQKKSGNFDHVVELDFGIRLDDNPLQRMFAALDLSDENFSNYKLYLTARDRAVGEEVMRGYPRPRIVLLEGLESETTRGWDPDKIPVLMSCIREAYGFSPIWFGGKYVSEYQGRPLTLRENIATLVHADVTIGVPSGPLHFAAAVGVPTLTLYGDQPLHRAAPAYFLNPYIKERERQHHTLLGPTSSSLSFLKNDTPSANLTPIEASTQHSINWLRPGRQSTKTCVAALTVDEVMTVLQTMLAPPTRKALA